MTSDVALLEDISRQIADVEPEVVAGHNPSITYPYLDQVRLSNFIRFYHPDGTHSDLAAPTFNPKRPSPWRERFIMQYLKKRRNGKQWFFLTPQAKPVEKPFRCFVVDATGHQCEKKLLNLPQLYMHVKTRHFEESKMYGSLLEAMNRKMQAQIDPALVKELGLPEPTAEPEVESSEQVTVFRCRVDGCPRFFDSEKARNFHETSAQSPHKKEKN